MAGIKVPPAVLAWGLAVAGAGVVYVSGGCKIIEKVQETQRRRQEEREAIRQSAYPALEVKPPPAATTTTPTPRPDIGPAPVPLPSKP